MAGVKVLLVELDRAGNGRLQAALRAQDYAVEVTDRMTQAIWVSRESDPVVSVVCVQESDRVEQEIATRMRQAGVETPLLVLVDRADPADVVRALDAGVDDLISRPVRLSEVLARVRALGRRPAARRPTVLEAPRIRIDLSSGEVVRCGRSLSLPPLQSAVLAELVSRPGRVLTRAELLDAVWDPAADPASNVVDQVIAQLRRRLDGPFGRRDLETVRGRGYRWRSGG